MATSEGTNVLPNDAAATPHYTGAALFDGTNFYFLRLDSVTAKNLRVALFDAAEQALAQASGEADNGAGVLKLGGVARDPGSLPADESAGDRIGLLLDLAGRLFVRMDQPLPAGSNAIGKLAANAGVEIGSVKVLDVVPGTAATALGKARDEAAGASDTGVAILGVRKDTPSTLVSADGDYSPLQMDAGGNLRALTRIPADGALVDANGASLTAKPVIINATADGDNTIVPAVVDKKIRVLSYAFTVNAAGTVTLKSGATDLALFALGQYGGATFAGSGEAWAFETAAGEALILNNPAGVDTFGHLTYLEV